MGEIVNRKRVLVGMLVASLVLAAFVAVQVGWSSAAQGRGDRSDAVTSDINVSGPFLQGNSGNPNDPGGIDRCGEPEITPDGKDPQTLVINCMSSFGLNYESPQPTTFLTWAYQDVTKSAALVRECHVFVSHDGGNTWDRVTPSPMISAVPNACGDPMANYGPHGEMYLAGNELHYPADGKDAPTYVDPPFVTLPQEIIGEGFSRSLDRGRTWSKETVVPLAIDRPLMTVDESTGVIYLESDCGNFNQATDIGPYGCTPGSRNLAVSTDEGRSWTPSVNVRNTLPPTTTVTPGRLHDVGIGNLDYIAAAQGVFGEVGSAGPNLEGGDLRRRSTAHADPPTLEFEYSTDNGATFTREDIPVGPSSTCATPTPAGLSADPTHRGTFALIVLCPPSARAARIFVTHDLGATWTETADLAVVPPPDYAGNPSPFGINRPWIAYGPTGALGVMWRQNYGTAPMPIVGMSTPGPQDVFLALSADGGKTFRPPIKLNTAGSPPPDPRQNFGDDLSHLMLDRHFAYVVWGDWRSGELETWFRKAPLPRRR